MTRPLTEQEVLSRMGIPRVDSAVYGTSRDVDRRNFSHACDCVVELLRSLGYEDVANEFCRRKGKFIR